MAKKRSDIRDFWEENKYEVCILLSVILVTIICLWNIGLQDRVRRVDDEIGYWGIAAQMAGYSWEGIMSHLQYYSFGYSFWLVPILWLHRLGVGMSVCYKLAIVLNVVMLDATFFMALYVAKRWAPKVNKYYRLLCVLMITLYSNNILHSNTAWSEICIYFLYWGIIVLAFRIFDYKRIPDMIALIVLSLYLFAVHMRMIAVPIAVVMVIALYFFKTSSKISTQKMLKIVAICAGGCLLAVVVVVVIKSYVEGNVYQMEGDRGINTFAGNLSKLKFFTTPAGWADIMLGFLGKVYYQGVASFLLSYLGFGLIAKRLFVTFRNRKQGVKFQSLDYVALLIILATIGSLMVSTLFKVNTILSGTPSEPRADSVIYGRYTEVMINILILIACLYLGQIRKHAELIVTSLVLMVITAIAVQYQWDALSFYQEIRNSNGVDTIAHFFVEGFDNTAYYAAVVAICVFGIICFACMREKISSKAVARVLVVVGLLLWYVSQGMNATHELAKGWKEKTVASVADLIELVEDVPVYCVGSPNTDIKMLQWEIAEREIYVITASEVETIKDTEAVVLSADDHVLIGQISDHMDFLYSSGTIAVYVNSKTHAGQVLIENIDEARSNVGESEGEVDLSLASGASGIFMYDGKIHYVPIEGNTEGFMTKGTGLQLEDGKYEFQVKLEIDNVGEGEIGYILGTNSKDTSVYTQMINKIDVRKGGEFTFSVQVDVEDFSEPYVLVCNYQNCDMTIEGISYKKIESVTPRNSAEMDELRRIYDIIEDEKPGRKKVYYIDSDGSGISGDPNLMPEQYGIYTEEGWGIVQLPSYALKYLSDKENCVFVMERTGDYKKFQEFLPGFYNRYETQGFRLYMQD